MADFLDSLGNALSNRFSNRSNEILNYLNNPAQAVQDRVEAATTATTYGAGAGRGFVNPAPVVPGEPPIAALPTPSVMPQQAAGPAVPSQNASAYGVGAQSGRRYAADQNNPSGLGWNGKDWNKYDTPEAGVQATEDQIGRYLSGKGPLKGLATPENVVSTWVTGGKIPADKIQGGAYAATVRQKLQQAGVQLNEDGSVPDTPEARKAIATAVVQHETLPQHREKFAPFLMGGSGKTQAAPQAQPAQAAPGAPATVAAPVNPADMGEFAGLDQAIAQQAAQPQPQYTNEQLDAAMAAEVQRQKDYEALNGDDWKRTLALVDSNDPAIKAQAASKLEEMFKDKRMREYAQTHVDSELNKGQIPDVKRLKGEEGSYIKAYLFARLGLNDLAQQEQEKISPTKQHMPVMVGDQRYSAVYSKNGELLSARDENGKLVDNSTLSKIAANAFASKGASTGQSMMKDAQGNIWSHTTTPGTNQIIWTNQTTGKAQTTAPTGLVPFGQVNPVTRANINLATSAERMMIKRNDQDRAAGLQPTYSQEAITAEKERILNGAQPSMKIEGETAPAAAGAAPVEGKRPVGEVERRGTPALEAQARAIYEGDQQMPTGMGANNARNQWLSARVQEMAQQEGKAYDPNIYANRKKTEASFTTGKQGDTVRAMNVAIDHLDTLNEAGKALKNGQIPLFNDIANKFAKNTGQSAPTDFNALKSIVGSEVAKAVAGGATALGDREEIRAEINNARSPEQLAGVIDKYQRLLAGQMGGLKTQYESGGGKHWQDKINPRTQEVMDKIEQSHKPAATAPAPYQDKSKEQRYQEWLKKHPEFQGTK